MSLESLVISLTILVIAALWIATPLLDRNLMRSNDAAQKHRDRLSANYERLLNNLRELDEDFGTGKLQADDHGLEREHLVQRGIRILMELDRLDTAQAQKASGPAADRSEESVDQTIENAVAAYRRKTHSTR